MIQPIDTEISTKKHIQTAVLRLDLMNLPIGGNKYYKLKYNLLEAKEKGFQQLLTFGGAYSNHLRAVALAGKMNGFKTIGLVRGEPVLPLNNSLAYAQEQGMELHYISRELYREKKEEKVIQEFRTKFGDFYLIPEGGSNVLALKGCMEIVKEIPKDYTHVALACGTGGTLAGISLALPENIQLLGFPVLKGGGFLEEEIEQLQRKYLPIETLPKKNYHLIVDYHFGGYAKGNQELLQFVEDFKAFMPLEYVYTGKLFYGALDLIRRDYFQADSKILILHTGGII